MTIRIIRILVMVNLDSTEEIITLMYYSLVRFLNITERLNKRWRLEQSLIQIQYEIMAFYLFDANTRYIHFNCILSVCDNEG